MGTYLSTIFISSMMRSTCERRPISLWQGSQRCTTSPSIPRSGTQPPHWFFPPFWRHSSFGHCTSILRPRLILSNTWLVSINWKKYIIKYENKTNWLEAKYSRTSDQQNSGHKKKNLNRLSKVGIIYMHLFSLKQPNGLQQNVPDSELHFKPKITFCAINTPKNYDWKFILS